MNPQRTSAHRLHRWRDPALLVACLISVLAVFAFLGIADIVFTQRPLLQLDTLVAVYVHQHTTLMGVRVMTWISALADPGVPILGVAVALLLAFRREGVNLMRWSVALCGSYMLNAWLKVVYDATRPPVSDPLHLGFEWGFPSGHALAALVGYGMLGVLLWDRIVERQRRVKLILMLITLVLLIGFSRLYIGAHYLGDVLAGYAVGIAWLAVCSGVWRLIALSRDVQ